MKPIKKQRTPEQKAHAARMFESLTKQWDEAGLDAKKIWDAKLRNSSVPVVIAMAAQINASGVVHQIKGFRHFKACYPDIQLEPSTPYYYLTDALRMAALSGCPESADQMAETLDGDLLPTAGTTNHGSWTFHSAR